MRLLIGVLAVAALGCTKPNPASCADDHCSDPSRPFCDVDGTIGGEPDTCIAVSCSAGAFAACRDDRALICNAAGTNYEVVDCEFGCSDAAGGCNACNTSECEQHIIPKYLPNVCNQLSEGALEITAPATIDTTFDLNCTSVVAQNDGPEICVIRAGSITIKPNQTLTVTGSRAIALVADRVLDISGTLDISANVEKDGPGGGTIRSGVNGGYPTAGGGAGYKTNGASGGVAGMSPQTGGAMNGGTAGTNPAMITSLLGGRRAQDVAVQNGMAGGGGGAATLISCRDKVDVTGVIDAGGGGGHSAFYPPDVGFTDLRQAAGGGSGGTVVLQGMAVRVTGQLFANGGGGGRGQPNGPGTPLADPGADGARSTMPAPGAAAVGESGGGGAGGAIGTPPGPGLAPVSSTCFCYAGAGGGSTGFLLTYTPDGVAPILTPSAVSPALDANGTVGTNR